MAGRTLHIIWRRVVAAAATGALVGAVAVVVAAGPAYATTVNCPADNLQTAINAAAPGATLTITGTCTGQFFVPKNLTLKGMATLDGANNGTTLAIPTGVTAKVLYLTIQHGKNDVGGGIFNSGTLTVTDATVTANTATGNASDSNSNSNNCTTGCTVNQSDLLPTNSGGGIYNTGTLTLSQSTVSNNTVSGSPTVTMTNTSQCTTNCSVTQSNLAVVNSGAGIFNLGKATLTASTVSGNSTSGSPSVTQTNTSGNCTTNCSATQTNVDVQFAGGGIYNHGTLTLNSSTVSGNSTSGTPNNSQANTAGGPCTSGCTPIQQTNQQYFGGGGIYTDAGMTFSSGRLQGNSTIFSGGGAFIQAGSALVRSSIVSSNSATSGVGGGFDNSGALTLNRDSITGNSALSGGGVFNNHPPGTVATSGTVISSNSPDNCVNC